MEVIPPIENTQEQPEIVTPTQGAEQLQCGICNTVLENDTPLTETLCRHRFHTQCFMVEIEHDFHCPQCNVCLLGPNHIHIHRENRRTQRDERRREERISFIQNQFITNETLPKDFKIIKKEFRKLASVETKYKKFYRTTNRTYQTETEFFVKMAKQKKKEYTNQLKTCAEYKEYAKQRRRVNRIVSQFEEQYDMTLRELTKVPDLKLKNYWYYNRMLYLRYSLGYLRRIRI